jgi:hypothetical protein
MYRQTFAPSATLLIVFRHGESPIEEADPSWGRGFLPKMFFASIAST